MIEGIWPLHVGVLARTNFSLGFFRINAEISTMYALAKYVQDMLGIRIPFCYLPSHRQQKLFSWIFRELGLYTQATLVDGPQTPLSMRARCLVNRDTVKLYR